MKHKVPDIPDPNTPEGLAEINRRLQGLPDVTKEDMERAIANAESEPTGKLTNPCEMDFWRSGLRDDE